MANKDTINEITSCCRAILREDVDKISVYQCCKLISEKRYFSGIDPYDDAFLMFIACDSELDEYPLKSPGHDERSLYLKKNQEEVSNYILSNKKNIQESAQLLLSKLEHSSQ